jgi:hypothetical protein
LSAHHHYPLTELVLVGPDLAKEWLEGSAPNRALSLRAVDRYADDMRAGRWLMNGQPVIFNREGALIDGRHRLSAILLAGVEVTLLVVRGVEQAAFTTMDSGRSRSIGDVLSIQGHKNTNVLSAVSRIVWNYCAGVSLRYQAPRAVLLELARDHPKLDDVIANVANKTGKMGSVVPVTQTSAVLALAGESGRWEGEMAAFLDGAINGEGLFKGDPRLALRNWIIRARQDSRPGAQGRYLGESGFAVVARCWTAFAREERLTTIVLPGTINAATVAIEGFERRLWPDVPDLPASRAGLVGAAKPAPAEEAAPPSG